MEGVVHNRDIELIGVNRNKMSTCVLHMNLPTEATPVGCASHLLQFKDAVSQTSSFFEIEVLGRYLHR